MGKISIELGDVTQHNIKQLKKINQLIFPVYYNDKFYKDVLDLGPFAKLVYFNDIVVGAVCCRIDTSENQRRMYIMTLGCLAPFRRYGVGTKLLDHVLEQAKKNNCDSAYLHVQVSNDSALAFYNKFDFKIVDKKVSYYKKIDPADAFLLQKNLKDGPNVSVGVTAPSTVNSLSSRVNGVTLG